MSKNSRTRLPGGCLPSTGQGIPRGRDFPWFSLLGCLLVGVLLPAGVRGLPQQQPAPPASPAGQGRAGGMAGTLAPDAPQAPTAPPPAPAETYRLRVENNQYGRVEVSDDGGAHYLLIGRVLGPATAAGADKSAAKPGTVLRSSGDGLAFAVSTGQALKLLPADRSKNSDLKPNKAASTLTTDLEPRKNIFGDLLPPAGTSVLVQSEAHPPRPLPEGYAPTPEDSFLFAVTLPFPSPKKETPPAPDDPRIVAWRTDLHRRLDALAQTYSAEAVARAQNAKRKVVSGILTLQAKLPAGEPEPITAVTYSIDGDMVAAQNVFPSIYGWDTRRVANGEHVIEIRAFNRFASLVTRVRALVVVQNPAP